MFDTTRAYAMLQENLYKGDVERVEKWIAMLSKLGEPVEMFDWVVKALQPEETEQFAFYHATNTELPCGVDVEVEDVLYVSMSAAHHHTIVNENRVNTYKVILKDVTKFVFNSLEGEIKIRGTVQFMKVDKLEGSSIVSIEEAEEALQEEFNFSVVDAAYEAASILF